MRLMVTYYDGNKNEIADIHVDAPTEEEISHAVKLLATSVEMIISVVEVLSGIDYDKEGYANSISNSDIGCPALMVLK